MKHQYRLEYKSDPELWPFSDDKIKVLNDFQVKYHALNTCNERLKRGTFHFGSDEELKLDDIEKDFSGFEISDFYSVDIN